MRPESAKFQLPGIVLPKESTVAILQGCDFGKDYFFSSMPRACISAFPTFSEECVWALCQTT